MKRIADLSKSELLGIIYHHLPHTIFEDHPCLCVACGDRPIEVVPVFGKDGDAIINHLGEQCEAMIYGFICDSCEKECEEYDKTHGIR